MGDQIQTAKDMLNQINATYRQANFAHAIDLARQALCLLQDAPEMPARETLRDSIHRRLVECLDRSLRFDEAFEEITQWEAQITRAEGRTDAIGLRARVSYRRGDFKHAMQHVDEGLSLAEASGYASGMAALMRFRADILWMQGHLEQALISGQQSLAIYERLDEIEGRARTLNTISAVYHMMGNHYRSIRYALKAISLLEAMDDKVGLRVLYNNVGESYQQIYAMDKALQYHEKAAALTGSHFDSDLARNLGVDMVAVGRVEEGLTKLHEALALAQQHQELDEVMQCLHSLADALFNVGKFDEAKKLALDLLEMAQPRDAVRHIIRALLILGHVAHEKNDLVGAQEFLHEGFMVAQRANDKTMIWQTHAALSEMLADSQPEIAAVHAHIAADMVNIMANTIEDEAMQRNFLHAPPIAKVIALTHKGRKSRRH